MEGVGPTGGEVGDGEGVCREFLLDMRKMAGIGYIKERHGKRKGGNLLVKKNWMKRNDDQTLEAELQKMVTEE